MIGVKSFIIQISYRKYPNSFHSLLNQAKMTTKSFQMLHMQFGMQILRATDCVNYNTFTSISSVKFLTFNSSITARLTP